MATDKAVIAGLLEARRRLKNGIGSEGLSAAAVLSQLEAGGAFGAIDLDATQVKKAFEGGQPLLARTLTKGTNGGRGDDGIAIPASYSPGKIERNTLNNRLGSLNVLLTPSTLIGTDVKVSTISSHPDRPRWSNMASVLYAVPAKQGQDAAGAVDTFRKSFGNTLSFASNHGFTPQFVEKVNSSQHSHAQLIDAFRAQSVIAANVKAPAPFNALPQSLPQIKQQIADFHADQKMRAAAGAKNHLYPDGTVPHNEVIARLWLWDASAIAVGRDLNEGLVAAIEMQIARKALRKELDQRGTDHPLYQQFLLQQLSIGPNNTSLSLAQTGARLDALSFADRKQVLDDLKVRLTQPIALCRYTPSDARLSGVGTSGLTGQNVLQAVDRVLATRLGPDGLRQRTE